MIPGLAQLPSRLTFVVAVVAALASPVRAFDGERAWGALLLIAFDDFQGRDSGLPGGRKGEDYVAARCAAWGLTPAGE
ncbi:MAG: hypothetical protein U0166_29780 [Acidobacteriota bacterium]